MANSYLNRTPSSASNRKTFTFSCWFKKSTAGSGQYGRLFSCYSDNNNRDEIYFHPTNDTINIESVVSSSAVVNFTSNKKFRDTNGWYHFVYAADTTQATESNRIKIYINGVQETSWSASTYPSQNTDLNFNNNIAHYIGRSGYNSGSNSYFDGYISHAAFVDGQQLTPTSFGETDSTSGIWKFKSPSGVTFGTNGFHLKFENSGALGTDSSGNSNTFTVNGDLRQALDTPSNIYCTMNPLQEPDSSQAVTFSLGNTKVAGNWSHWQRVFGTMGATKGKWFYEFKNLQDDGSAGHCRIGWDSIDNINMTSSGQASYYGGLTLDREGKLRGGISGYSGYDPNAVQMTAAHSGGNFSFTANDIIGMAIDLDNETFSVYKNGNLEINAYSYAGLSNNSISKSRGFFIAPSYNWYSTSSNNNRSCFNFGNGHFETTAITSAGSNGNGSLFEYDVPSGYYAWNTKNINTYG